MCLLSVRANAVKTNKSKQNKKRNVAPPPLCLVVESKWSICVFAIILTRSTLCPHPGVPCTAVLCLPPVPTDLLSVEVLLSGLEFQKQNLLVGKQGPRPPSQLPGPLTMNSRGVTSAPHTFRRSSTQLTRTSQGHPVHQHWAPLMNASIVEAVPATQRGKFLPDCFLFLSLSFLNHST